ncbi:MAG: peptide chain release factor 2 [SAR324 cluster bacterium]|nr:peptide chain release factor 2 [SAR324 cluster bacterium]
MMEDLKMKIEEIKVRQEAIEGYFDIPEKRNKLQKLEAQSSKEEFWSQPRGERTVVLKNIRRLNGLVEDWETFQDELEELETGLSLIQEENDPELLAEIQELGANLEKRLSTLEVTNLLGGEQDQSGAILHVHSGAGGTESADWCQMLFRMYQRWSESHGYKITTLDYQPGEEAGIKSVTLTIAGDYAYGNLKTEVGVHRLVRISPFDQARRRHTSFASVFVYPDVEDDITVEINEADLQVDTYRAQGAGGQHINTTDSAVRITHGPSGIVVQCQNERSQHKNRATAMRVLRARLYERELKERASEKEKLHAQKQQIAWGSQIRSYVLHPYQMVKDHRTDTETGNAQKVLDGDLDEFIEQALLKKVV